MPLKDVGFDSERIVAQVSKKKWKATIVVSGGLKFQIRQLNGYNK